MNRLFVVALIASVMLMGCYTTGPYTREGVLLGSVIGGVTGAVVGNQVGSSIAGAAIGAGVGALAGGAIGNAHDKADAAYYRAGHGYTAYAAPSTVQEPVSPPPGKWVTVPGQWVGGRWVPSHKVWVPVNP